MLYVFLVFNISFGIVYYMWKQADKWKLETSTLTYEDFPEGFDEIKLFFISDIHKRSIPDEMIEFVKGKADLVLLGGDLMERGVPFDRVRKNIQQLKRIGPVYFVWGNNDYEVDYHQLDALLLDEGVIILDNTAVTFESKIGEKLILLGVDCPTNKRDNLPLALKDSEEGFKILMSHDPSIVDKIHIEDNIRLTVAGHTHGGQIRIGPFGLYEKGGIKELNETVLFVSNGYGTSALPLRLGAPAQVHLITITSS
ncbi:metallophosphoesterase [Bacillus solimangrovi]|uniref:Metallophosphoesterase n=1 Tax=Bacillus solimangrovi TaxID=1305675 RepID=A0A1E5LHF9_9BACI|nr:metallophosphoesterase [Bacillus solimangrovi]OEH93486.1 metallophosphoesterase [Bacillus solimangrovi]